MKNLFFVALFFLLINVHVSAQSGKNWNGKRAAVVLTYDDAIDTHLDHVVPALDSLGLKGTFYMIGSSPVTNNCLEEWRIAAKKGHELGNHSMFHPCTGGPGRTWLNPENDLRIYTVARAVKEIRMTNVLLKAIDGKNDRTFAFPCGDLKIGDEFFYDQLKSDFVGARGVRGALNAIDKTDINNVDSYSIQNAPTSYMIDLVKKATESGTLVVFLFHGVGGGHNINEGLKEHSELLHYLKLHERELWIAPMVDVAKWIKEKQPK